MNYRTPHTRLIHAGEPRPRLGGAVALPVFQSSTFEYRGETSYHDVRYIRLNNTPNHNVLAEKLAAVSEAEAALPTASGMAAITTALLAVLKAGDHLLVQGGLYGGTHDFLTHDLEGFGIAYDFIDSDAPETWRQVLKPETKAIYVESLSNPLLEMPDLESAVAFAREHGLVSLIDNTFPSPINFRPCPFGFDLELHSATKYLNGHTDIVAGAVVGKADLVEQILYKLNHLGGTLDPHACFLLHRGMKTLALRMAQHNANAQALAEALDAHPAVTKVHYPGLPSHSQHERAKRLLDGFGGMLSFELEGGLPAVNRLFDRLELPVVAPSLGGVETLITLPSTTSHAGMSPDDRHALGITDSLVRVSVGIEDTEELVEDFRRGLG